jgi:hypothetical protein
LTDFEVVRLYRIEGRAAASAAAFSTTERTIVFPLPGPTERIL